MTTKPFLIHFYTGQLVLQLAGVVLLFAAIMKALHISGNDRLMHHSVHWILYGIEATLGLWFLSGKFPYAGQRVGLVVFSAFVVQNIRMVIQGTQSCGCFGNLQVNTHHALLFDVCITALLAWMIIRGKIDSKATFVHINEKRSQVIISLALLFGAIVGSLLVANPMAKYKAVRLDADIYDFGEVRSLARVTHDFLLQNRSAERIKILQIRHTCSCSTTDNLTGVFVEAGADLTLSVTVRVADDEGRQVGDVYVVYGADDGSSGTLAARILVSPQPSYRIDPQSRFVDFGDISDGGSVARRIVLIPIFDSNVRIQSAFVTGSCFRAVVCEGGREVDITFEAKTGRAGNASAFVTLKTNSNSQPTTIVFVRGRCHTNITVEPNALVVSSDTTGLVVRDIVTFCAKSTLQLVSAHAQDDRLLVNVLPSVNGSNRSVRVAIPTTESVLYRTVVVMRFKYHGLDSSRPDEVVELPVFRIREPE